MAFLYVCFAWYHVPMHTFFHGWQRKTGVFTLLVACVFATGWARSLITDDYVVAFRRSFISTKGRFYLGHQFSLDHRSLAWEAGPGLFPPMNTVEIETVGAPYSIVAAPLTLTSAYLILWKPRKRKTSDQPMNPNANSN